jgi:hypothetical protein
MIIPIPRPACRTALAAAMAGFAVLSFAPPPAAACSVPVFRYAMERWPPEPYEATLFHLGPLSAADEALAKALEAGFAPADPARPKAQPAPPNLLLERIDVGGQMNERQRKFWEAQKDAPIPHVVIRYPASEDADPPVWSGPLAAEPLRLALDSPARREVARRLLGGESAVWVLLESGDKAKDEAAAALLAGQSRWAEQKLELPPQDDPADEDGGGRGLMRSAVPLRLKFSTLRLSRRDAAEAVFIAMLKRVADKPPPDDQPVAFPIFGRGRALEVLHDKTLSEEVLREVSAFLVGPCSCQVKDMNPGMDLLMSADWESFLEGEASAAGPAPAAAARPASAAPAPLPPAPAAAPGTPLLTVALIGVGGAAALVIAAVTAVLLARPRKR